MEPIRVAFCPTRRDVFSAEEAGRYAGMIRESLNRYEAEIVDIQKINQEGLLYSDTDLPSVIQQFKSADVDAVFFPHCNFGSENLVAQVAKELQVPVLLWGPRDNAPSNAGFRDRDSQCGLFATGKILRRHNVPFTYLTNSWVDSREFHDGFQKFLAVANIVRDFNHLRILQISTRPEPFCSVMCSEAELVEKFNIHIYPITLTELVREMEHILQETPGELSATVSYIESIGGGPKDAVRKVAALKIAMKRKAAANQCKAIAIQCWSALQDLIGIMPCLSNALLTDEGIPVACETDIHGAVTAVMMHAATRYQDVPFFADITVRHPDKDNAELLWHCGNFPYSLAASKADAETGYNLYNAQHCYGIGQWELRQGDLTIARFDGDHGKYSLLIGEARTTTGPKNLGTYVWIETSDWPRWEHRLVEGPYIHHVACCYGHVGEILQETCKYIPDLVQDVVEPSPDELEKRWY